MEKYLKQSLSVKSSTPPKTKNNSKSRPVVRRVDSAKKLAVVSSEERHTVLTTKKADNPFDVFTKFCSSSKWF